MAHQWYSIQTYGSDRSVRDAIFNMIEEHGLQEQITDVIVPTEDVIEVKDGKKKIILADEISPDTCRLWDASSEKKLDKDRFRKDLGNIIQAYQEVARRLGIIHEEANISEV